MEGIKIWDTTLYLRISKDDGDKEVSNSIIGQKELLREYLLRHEDLREYAVRVDDGYTGSNFDRPAFKAMMDDIRAGRTNCIIVKDLSRFGRNYLDAGEFIEKIFPFLGVRFISINDHYDSENGRIGSDELVIPFKNLINEAYCRDTSIKIRSQLEIKRKKGDFVGSFAVYGYLKDPNNKNRLIVDEYAADMVRDIFKKKLEGVSPADIANRLNEAGILSPLEYKRSLGMKCYTPFMTGDKALWSAASIIRVLKNPVYIGTLIQGKVTTPSYKVKKLIQKPQKDWAVIENNHEAIVRQTDFDSVQKILAMDTRTSPGQEAVQLFSGLVFCGECGESMVRKTVFAGRHKYIYYVCSGHKAKKSCFTHSVRDIVLEDIVFCALKRYIAGVIELEAMLSLVDTALISTAKVQKVWRQLEKKQKEVERFEKLRMSLYENMHDGLLDKSEYEVLKETYSLRSKESGRQAEILQEQIEKLAQDAGEENSWMEEFRKHRNITGLDRVVLVTLIERIFVYKDKRIEVVYRWSDEFISHTEILSEAREQDTVPIKAVR